MRSSKHAIWEFTQKGIPKDKIDVVSFGNGGAWLFYIDKNNKLKKHQLKTTGITYFSMDDLNEMIDWLKEDMACY